MTCLTHTLTHHVTYPNTPSNVLDVGYDGRETEQGFSVGVHMDSALRPFNQRIELTLDDDEGTTHHLLLTYPSLTTPSITSYHNPPYESPFDFSNIPL